MKESTQEKNILKQSIKFLQKDSKSFYITAFSVSTALFLLQVALSYYISAPLLHYHTRYSINYFKRQTRIREMKMTKLKKYSMFF